MDSLPEATTDASGADAAPPLRFESLTRLLQVALQLGTERNLDRILQIATRGVCDAVGCQRASLFVRDEATNELYTRVVTELEIAEIRHPISRGVIGWVATTGELANVPHPPSDPRWDGTVDRRTGFRTQNILAAPVRDGLSGPVLGVLQLLNKTAGFDRLDEQLLQAFAAHVALAMQRSHLEAQASRANEFRHALEMGRRIQSSFLPTELPQIDGYDVAVWWQPAEFISGDYYDWHLLSDGRWGFTLGDVSGHGLAAALIMASVRAMAHVLAQTETDPQRFVELLRDSLESDLRDGRFLTFLCVAVDTVAHRATVWNAGHAPAYHFDASTQACTRLTPTATPLGFPQVAFADEELVYDLAPGDWLILGTDGVIEVRNDADQMFGNDRLQQLVREHAAQSAAEMVTAISTAVQIFHGRNEPPDDTTLVVIRRASASSTTR